MTEHDMEELLWKFPDRLLNEPLEPFRKQPSSQVGRADLIFKDPLGRFLVVEIKKGVLPRGAVNQLVDYYGMLKREFQNESVELMAVANSIPEDRAIACLKYDIEPREISEKRFADLAREVALRELFPHYEDFWRQHVYPLRSAGSIHPRKGLDEKFEYLAMFHYSTFVSLARAHQKIQSESEAVLFPDEAYWNLSRAAEVALKVVETFCGMYQDCLGRSLSIDTAALDRVLEKMRRYRNMIHAPIHAVGVDSQDRRQIPRPEKLEEYPKWSDTLYDARPQDFVGVETQLNNDFHALCSALEGAWKEMCSHSEDITSNIRYLQRRNAGASVHVTITASSSAASASPTATVVRLVPTNRREDG